MSLQTNWDDQSILNLFHTTRHETRDLSLTSLLFLSIRRSSQRCPCCIFHDWIFSKLVWNCCARDGFKGLRGEPFKESVSVRPTRVRKDVRGLGGFSAIAEYVARSVTKTPLISVSSLSFNLSIPPIPLTGFVPFACTYQACMIVRN